jgi:PBSX family phage portal protein
LKKVTNDDEDELLTPHLGPPATRQLVSDVVDPFAVAGEDLRKIGGLNPNVRRTQTRRMEKVYTGHGDSHTKRDETEGQIDAYNLFGVVLPKYNMDYLARIYEMSAPHYAAVKAKVANIAGLGYDFLLTHAMQRKLADTTDPQKLDRMRKKLDDTKEQLYGWLDGCNEEDTFSETLIKVWTDYEVTGNGYIEIGRQLDGTIGYVGHIPSTTMRIRKQRDGYVQMVGKNARFFRNFGDKTTPDRIGNDPVPNEVIHIKKYSPTSQFYGVPDIVAAQQAVVGNEFAARFNLDYFENKAVPRYVIVVKGANFSKTGEQNILEFFETGLKGRNHRTIYVPLPADEQDRKYSFEMKPVEAGTQDSSFVNYRKGNLSDILMAHRVPITKVDTASGLGLAAARDADKNFKEQVCRPEQKMFEKKINKIITEVTDIFRLKLNELALTDEDTQSKINERRLRLNEVTVNEVRAERGLSPLSWGDQKTEIAATGLAQATVDFQNKTLKLQEKQGTAQANAQAAAAPANPTANEQRAQTTGNRTRDQQRTANATDSAGNGRAAQGAGRTQG